MIFVLTGGHGLHTLFSLCNGKLVQEESVIISFNRESWTLIRISKTDSHLKDRAENKQFHLPSQMSDRPICRHIYKNFSSLMCLVEQSEQAVANQLRPSQNV